MRGKDRRQDTSFWVRRNRLINMWRDLEARTNKIGAASKLLLNLTITAFSFTAIAREHLC